MVIKCRGEALIKNTGKVPGVNPAPPILNLKHDLLLLKIASYENICRFAVFYSIRYQLPDDVCQPLGIAQYLRHFKIKIKPNPLLHTPGSQGANFLRNKRLQKNRLDIKIVFYKNNPFLMKLLVEQ
ncbi:hypothetical protein D3C81_1582480 [compost metagenome]